MLLEWVITNIIAIVIIQKNNLFIITEKHKTLIKENQK